MPRTGGAGGNLLRDLPSQRMVTLPAKYRAPAEPSTQHQYRVGLGGRGRLRGGVAVCRRGPARQQSVEPPREQRRRREVAGGHLDAMRADRELQDLETFLEAAFVLEEVRVEIGRASCRERV